MIGTRPDSRVPVTLRAVLGARIDALPIRPPARRSAWHRSSASRSGRSLVEELLDRPLEPGTFDQLAESALIAPIDDDALAIRPCAHPRRRVRGPPGQPATRRSMLDWPIGSSVAAGRPARVRSPPIGSPRATRRARPAAARGGRERARARCRRRGGRVLAAGRRPGSDRRSGRCRADRSGGEPSMHRLRSRRDERRRLRRRPRVRAGRRAAPGGPGQTGARPRSSDGAGHRSMPRAGRTSAVGPSPSARRPRSGPMARRLRTSRPSRACAPGRSGRGRPIAPGRLARARSPPRGVRWPRSGSSWAAEAQGALDEQQIGTRGRASSTDADGPVSPV